MDRRGHPQPECCYGPCLAHCSQPLERPEREVSMNRKVTSSSYGNFAAVNHVLIVKGWRRPLAIGIVLGGSVLAPSIGSSLSAGATAAHAKRPSCFVPRVALPTEPTSAPDAGAPRAWPFKILVKNASVEVFDSVTGRAYGLSPERLDGAGPDLLQAVALKNGRVHEGPTIGLGDGYSASLSLADGSLWVGVSLGRGNEPSGPELCQVNPVSLHLVRQVSLPPPKSGDASGFPTQVSPGPNGTLWVGYGDKLVDLNARTVRIVTTDTVASGFITSLATDPKNQLLYVSVSYPTIDGKMVDAAVEERLATSGQLLQTTSATSPVTGSVAGGILTALPGGVATSFRTGMMGDTELLDAKTLMTITPPVLGRAPGDIDKPPDDVFGWPMGASTLYAAGSLWIQNEFGVLACVNPATGALFASEQPPHPNAVFMILLGTQRASHQLLAAFGNEVIRITAPKACWH